MALDSIAKLAVVITGDDSAALALLRAENGVLQKQVEQSALAVETMLTTQQSMLGLQSRLLESLAEKNRELDRLLLRIKAERADDWWRDGKSDA